MNRRSFISSLLAACAAPAIVRAESLMPCRGVLVPQQLIVPIYWPDFEVSLQRYAVVYDDMHRRILAATQDYCNGNDIMTLEFVNGVAVIR